jgi:hypothetical protein
VYFIPFIALVSCRDIKSFDDDFEEAYESKLNKANFIQPSSWLSERMTTKPLILKTSGGQSFHAHIIVRKSAASKFLPKALYSMIHKSQGRYELAKISNVKKKRMKRLNQLFFYRTESSSEIFNILQSTQSDLAKWKEYKEEQEENIQPYLVTDDSWCLKYDDREIMSSWKGFSVSKNELKSMISESDREYCQTSKKRKLESVDGCDRKLIVENTEGLTCREIEYLLRNSYEMVFGPMPKSAIQFILLNEKNALVQLSSNMISDILLEASKKMKIDG